MKTEPFIEFLIAYGNVLLWLLFFALILVGIGMTVHFARPARSKNPLP